jgi:rod shape-determining protein MreC
MNTIPLRKVLGLVLVFSILCGSFIVLDRRSALDPVRSGLNEIVSPVSSAFYRALDGPGSETSLEQELATAVAERDALKAENSQLKADTAELEQLRQMLDVENRNPSLDLTRARVISQDPSGAQMFIVIDVGSEDGVREGMAIVSPYFYLGQVTEVTPETSKVMLIIDASQSVGAMLEDSQGSGIVKGQWQLGGYLTMLRVQPQNPPTEGEWVVTSDSSDTQTRQVPPNIPIGQVFGEPVVNEQTATLEIQVRPGVSNISDLTVVYVAVETDE